jgi:type II secretory pathway pseudopilin PulG
LLVVIAIIAILAAILFPVFGRAKEQAKATVCLSNAREVGLAVVMYLTDSDGTYPIHYAYNSQPPAGQPGHKGVEVELAPYVQSAGTHVDAGTGLPVTPLMPIFQCPLDTGGPFTSQDVPGSTSYWSAYGSSYRFTHCMFSVVAGESTQNNVPESNTTTLVNESSVAIPAQTRIMRDEMMSFFAATNTPGACAQYGYDCPPPNNYFRPWHTVGGTLIFAEGHAKLATGSAQFDATAVDPQGDLSGAPNAQDGTWYWACD